MQPVPVQQPDRPRHEERQLLQTSTQAPFTHFVVPVHAGTQAPAPPHLPGGHTIPLAVTGQFVLVWQIDPLGQTGQQWPARSVHASATSVPHRGTLQRQTWSTASPSLSHGVPHTYPPFTPQARRAWQAVRASCAASQAAVLLKSALLPRYVRPLQTFVQIWTGVSPGFARW
jgi:hypothetical protein